MEINEDSLYYNKISSLEEADMIVEAFKKKHCKDCDKKPVDKKSEEEEEGEKGKDEKGNPVLDDHFEVKYSDLDAEPRNIFKHILIFTNDKDPKNNKTLKNVIDAVKELKHAHCDIIPKLHVFIAEELTYEEDDNNILSITDGSEVFKFDEVSNYDTLVFSRLGVQGEDNCEHVVELLQDRGFLVLNPVSFSQLACNKYDTAVLLDKAEIPQPRFCLMTKDILYDEEGKQYHESMKKIYPDWDSEDPDKNEDFSFVVKILDGHGGTGVFTCDGKKILAILQTIFAVDEERQLIIQKKEEGDGGDIRVHVLTLRNKQVILGAMKRVKLGGDFRSNVSLGAEAEPVKLTPEQEQIALKVAKLSKMPWCAVDIMPLVKGSNPELGDNVVLEINASPGTDGISEVLDHNFINIMLTELDEPKEFMLQNKLAGYMESVTIDFGEGAMDVLAKLDTGNGAKASHVEVGKMELYDDDKKVKFEFNGKHYDLEVKKMSKAITGTQVNKRPVVVLDTLKLGPRVLHNIPMAIVETRGGKSSNALINRETMSWLGYIVSPSQTHILTTEMEKVNII